MEQQLPSSEVTVSASKRKVRWGRSAAIIGVFIVLLAAVGATGYLWKLLHTDQQQLASVERTMTDMSATVKQQQVALQTAQQELQILQQQTQRDGVIMAEARYLVDQAAFKVKFDHDAISAAQFLQLADQRAQAGTSALLPLRQALAQDLTALNAVPKVDVPGLVARLGALGQQLESLPQVPNEPPKVEEPAPAAPVHATETAVIESKVKLFFVGLGEAIKNLVVVTHNDEKTTPFLLTNEQRTMVVTSIQAQLTMAQWALVQRQSAVYQQSLQQAIDWVDTYFFKQSPAVVTILQTLQELKDTAIDPALPNPTHSLEALEKLQQTATAAVAPKEEEDHA